MKMKFPIAMVGFLLAAMPLASASDCAKISESIKSAILQDSSRTIQIVVENLEAAPSCACEIVKAAIQASHADADLVASIVENAILAAPEQIRMISQCAIATAPDALPQIQAVLAKLDPHAGESHRSSKHVGKQPAKEASPITEPASMFNPLDFPGDGPIGPRDGLPQGGIPGGQAEIGSPEIGSLFRPFVLTPPTPELPPVDPDPETPVNPLPDFDLQNPLDR